MKRILLLTPGAILAVTCAITVAFAQSSAQSAAGEGGTTEAEAQPSYSEASLKFDILEAQLQTLRKKMQLRSKQKAERTREWNEHYEKVKREIEAWDDFVDSYDVE